MKSALTKTFSVYQGLPGAAWYGIILNFSEATFVGICYFLSIYFVKVIHFNVIEAGFVISAYGIGTVIGGYSAGKLCDQYEPNHIQIISLCIQAIAYFILIFLTSFHAIFIDLFFLGVGSYGFITSNHVWVLKQCINHEMQRLKAINLLSVASNLGLSVSGMVIGLVPIAYFKILFCLISVSLLTICIYLLTQPTINTPMHQTTLSENKNNTNMNSNRYILLYVFTNLFIVGLIISQLNSNYPLYLSQLFPISSDKYFGILLTLNSMMVVLLQTPLGNYAGQFNKLFVTACGAWLLGIGMSLLNFATSLSIAILSSIVYTIGEMLFFSVAQLICYENASQENKGKSLGFYRMVYAASRVAGPAIGSVIYSYSPHALWLSCGVLGFICFLPIFYFKRSNKPFSVTA